MQVKVINDKAEWEGVVADFAAHPLQSWQWGDLKSSTGPWESVHLVCEEQGVAVGGAQVLLRKIPFPLRRLAYVPRGPFAREDSEVPAIADAVAQWCKKNTPAICLRIEPELTEAHLSASWRETDHILLRKTAVIDLTPNEDDIMAAIPNRKCRQYIRKAPRDGVSVRVAVEDDMDAILDLYHATAEADGFPLHVDGYYRAAFGLLEGPKQLFVAEQEGVPQAFLWNVTTPGGTTFELWGAVSEAGKRSRANYYLKWCAICEAKKAGAVRYDLNGLLNDGISDFKLLFAKDPVYWIGTFDRPLNPFYHVMVAGLKARDAVSALIHRNKD